MGLLKEQRVSPGLQIGAEEQDYTEGPKEA